ncbi:hypothetical protein M1523_02480 [Patescibacteria group bacterium]|nr:hypothetical protein [Patescibacteria group bacterium]MCL5091412.1 hypothetical protein [Patescibacteria group bacterium]
MANQTVQYFITKLISSRRLSPKEEDVLVRRLKKQRLAKIGKKYRVTDERVRQIEKSALKKLKSKTCQERLL